MADYAGILSFNTIEVQSVEHYTGIIELLMSIIDYLFLTEHIVHIHMHEFTKVLYCNTNAIVTWSQWQKSSVKDSTCSIELNVNIHGHNVSTMAFLLQHNRALSA